MRSLLALVWSPWLAVVLAPAACIDTPPEPGAVVARLVAAWDPLACGDPHRVAIELEDETGATVSASAPCNLGGVTVDVPHLGSYGGRIYAWALDAPIRSSMPISLVIDQSITHWFVATPP
jgi:hypothetical protein